MGQNEKLAAESHIELDQRIRRRAHEIWESRDGKGGARTDLDDWLEAEREILGANAKDPAQNRGATVGDAHTPDFSRIEELGEA